ncbi:MAG: hypothetical protein HY907_11610 [Deltaproteobacteria bacterium]|nr:hypothetical protein [Deltaproteobacteria bacterium]
MSRPGDLTPAQRALLDRLGASDLASSFYLTGGVALSAFHLHHRDSKDFADLLFLLRRDDVPLVRTIDDCRRKFGWPALERVPQTALLKVERLPGWPQTEPHTTLDEARAFFRDIVRTLIRVEED